MMNILNIFIILKKVQDFSQNISELENDGQDWESKSKDWIEGFEKAAENEKYTHIITWIRKFNELLLKIQVATYNSKEDTYFTQNVYYPKFPVFNFLSEKTKDIIMFNVTRATKRDKLIGLLEKERKSLRKLNGIMIWITRRRRY